VSVSNVTYPDDLQRALSGLWHGALGRHDRGVAQ